MNKKGLMITLIVFLAVILISAFSVTLYFVLDNAVTEIVVSQVDELISHDIKLIRNYINRNYEMMEFMKESIRLRAPSSTEDLLLELTTYAYTDMCDAVYLLDSENNLYTSYRIVKPYDPSAENEIISYFLSSDSTQFVHRLNDYTEYQRECMLTGMTWDSPIKLFGKDFIGIAMLRDISYIRESLRVTSFDNRGYTALIDENADYIVNQVSATGLQQYQNFFANIENTKIQGTTFSDICNKVNSDRDVSFWYTDEYSVKHYVSVNHIDDSGWSFVTEIENSVFREQMVNTARITSIVFAEVVVLMLTIFFLIYRVRVKSRKQYESIVAGVFNRQYYNDKLATSNARAVAMFDIDHLKQINDTYGHITGDIAIREMVTTIAKFVGKSGMICRFGGDEFVVVWKDDIGVDSFKTILESICAEVREFEIEEHPELKLSFSIGGYYGSDTSDKLMAEADKLLYEAKKERNSVVVDYNYSTANV